MAELKRQKERLIALLLVGFLALNYPILSLFSSTAQLFSLPVLYVYLFSIWVLFIVLLAAILEKKERAAPDKSTLPGDSA